MIRTLQTEGNYLFTQARTLLNALEDEFQAAGNRTVCETIKGVVETCNSGYNQLALRSANPQLRDADLLTMFASLERNLQAATLRRLRRKIDEEGDGMSAESLRILENAVIDARDSFIPVFSKKY